VQAVRQTLKTPDRPDEIVLQAIGDQEVGHGRPREVMALGYKAKAEKRSADDADDADRSDWIVEECVTGSQSPVATDRIHLCFYLRHLRIASLLLCNRPRPFVPLGAARAPR
jgi:hypothetical protein